MLNVMILFLFSLWLLYNSRLICTGQHKACVWLCIFSANRPLVILQHVTHGICFVRHHNIYDTIYRYKCSAISIKTYNREV